MLYEAFMTPCTRLERNRVPDGEGGKDTEWADGAAFEAAVVLNGNVNARVAEAQGVMGVYTVTAPMGTGLAFHEAFRRDSDGMTFRVTKVNAPTPDVASFEFEQYQAEEWELA